MLKLGSQDISGLYLGEQKIKKAYLGEALVFEEKVLVPPSRLPEGYVEVEYIQSSGTQCINTKYVLSSTVGSNQNNNNTGIEMDVETLIAGDSTIRYFFGSGYAHYEDSWAKNWYYNHGGIFIAYNRIAWSNQQGSGNALGNNGITITSDVSPRRMKIKMETKKKACVDDSCVTSGNSFNPTGKAVLLFTTSNYATKLAPFTPGVVAKLYSCKIYNPFGTMIRDYVPCISPGGEVGLYDLVTQEFYGNFGTGSFIAGPAV